MAVRINIPLILQAHRTLAHGCGGPVPGDLPTFLEGIDCSMHMEALVSQEFTLDTLVEDTRPECEDRLTSERLCAATKIPAGASRRILDAARKLWKRRAQI